MPSRSIAAGINPSSQACTSALVRSLVAAAGSWLAGGSGGGFTGTVAPAAQPAGSVTASSPRRVARSEEHTSELQSRGHLVCRLLLEKKNKCISHVATS